MRGGKQFHQRGKHQLPESPCINQLNPVHPMYVGPQQTQQNSCLAYLPQIKNIGKLPNSDCLLNIIWRCKKMFQSLYTDLWDKHAERWMFGPQACLWDLGFGTLALHLKDKGNSPICLPPYPRFRLAIPLTHWGLPWLHLPHPMSALGPFP